MLFLSLIIFTSCVSKLSEKEFLIPGIEDGFVPQGICYVDSINSFLVSGYMNDGSNSRIYQISHNKTKKYILLINNDLTPFNFHAGGIASDGKNIWVCADTKISRFLVKDLTEENTNTLIEIDSKELSVIASFCFYTSGLLYVGEFYHSPDYPTSYDHRIVIDENTINHALVACYEKDSSMKCGINDKIKYAISIPSKIQGIAITPKGSIFISSSYGTMNDSYILFYRKILNRQKSLNESISLNKEQIPLYILSYNNISKTIITSSMAEGLEIVSNKLYVVYESNAKKYRNRAKNVEKNIYSFSFIE